MMFALYTKDQDSMHRIVQWIIQFTKQCTVHFISEYTVQCNVQCISAHYVREYRTVHTRLYFKTHSSMNHAQGGIHRGSKTPAHTQTVHTNMDNEEVNIRLVF